MENSMEGSQKTEHRTTVWSSNPTAETNSSVKKAHSHVYYYSQSPGYGINLNAYQLTNG
jgi:hypothetical protein